MSEVLRTVIERLRDARDVERAEIDRITVGDRVLLVEVRDRESGEVDAGLAHRPSGAFDGSETSEGGKAAEPADDYDLEGLLADVARDAAPLAERALGIAAANALSAPLVDWRRGDPMALLDEDVERIATVGLFGPAFRKFDGVEVRVIERDPIEDVPDPGGVEVRTYTPAGADVALRDAEVVFVTGSALIYGGIDQYLAAAPDEATVVVIGATASFLPEPLFEAGVDVVAGASVVDTARARDAVAAGACGTDLHEAGVEKVCVAGARPAGVRLGGQSEGTDGERTQANPSHEESTNL
ncbi:MAG: Rossmann-like domain-containing protein [Halobellus sp.]